MILKLDTGNLRGLHDVDASVTECLGRFPTTGKLTVTCEPSICLCHESLILLSHEPTDQPLEIVNAITSDPDITNNKVAYIFAARMQAKVRRSPTPPSGKA